ncbi:MAG: copper chaperone PCu(A)C [Pseudomonadota bacterium]
MNPLLRNLTLAAATLFAAGSAFADSHKGMHGMQHGDIQIQHAYARAVPPGQPNSAAFMTLRNQGDAANAVVSASSSAAKVVELHTHTMDGGMMKMRKIEKIDIPAKGEAVLKPGGLHIMLIGLKQQLKPGMKVSLTLKFSDGSESTVDAPVQQVMKMMDHKMNDNKPMKH